MKNYTNLNTNEIAVLKAIVDASIKYTGGDFTYFNEVMEQITDLTDKQVKGYISQLTQKDYIRVSNDKYCQIFAPSHIDYLIDYEF
jgi:hypothetical protein